MRNCAVTVSSVRDRSRSAPSFGVFQVYGVIWYRAWIFSGYDDPFMLGVNLKDYKNGKLTPNAKIEVIRIAPAVG